MAIRLLCTLAAYPSEWTGPAATEVLPGLRQHLRPCARHENVPFNVDASLVEAASSDQVALEQLISIVWPEAFRLAAGILHDRSLAEDAAQEACAAMAVSLTSLQSFAKFRSWFYRLVSISRRRPKTVELGEATFRPMETDGARALDLSHALRNLPAQQRALVLLHYYVGLNSREIGVATDLAAATVRFQLMLARRALRRALSVAAQPASKEALSHGD
jgi:RNA polymerase sigma-70 factor (ECF subfamily)